MRGRPGSNRDSQGRRGREPLDLLLNPARDTGEKLEGAYGLADSGPHGIRESIRGVVHIDCDLIGKGGLPAGLDVMKFGLGVNLPGFF